MCVAKTDSVAFFAWRLIFATMQTMLLTARFVADKAKSASANTQPHT